MIGGPIAVVGDVISIGSVLGDSEDVADDGKTGMVRDFEVMSGPVVQNAIVCSSEVLVMSSDIRVEFLRSGHAVASFGMSLCH